ncbi:MAG: SDR family NAD(P)-dependent oxidoreductase, partial [Candidatus Sericytochromatia bacterium]
MTTLVTPSLTAPFASLAGKSVFVTGAASGIGAEIATAFARAGARVAVSDLNGEAAEAATATVDPPDPADDPPPPAAPIGLDHGFQPAFEQDVVG